MTPLDLLAYVADACILLTYLMVARNPERMVWMNLANAVGGIPLLYIEVTQGLWQVFPVTLAFTFIGWYGLYAWAGERAT